MYRRDIAGYLSYDDWASQNIIEYAAGKGFDNMGGSGGGMWGSWSSTPIFGLVQGRKPRYETEGYDYMELGIVGYQWSYTPGNGGSPFDQVMGDPAVSSAGSPIGEWGGGEAQQGGPRITGAVINTGTLSSDNNCANCGFFKDGKLGTNVRPDAGFFNGIEIQFNISGNMDGHTIRITRTKTFGTAQNGRPIPGESGVNEPDNIFPGNRQLLPVNGKVFSVDAPGLPMEKYMGPGILTMESIGYFTETAQIFNSNGEPVGKPYSIEWSSHIFIQLTNGQWEYSGTIGPR